MEQPVTMPEEKEKVEGDEMRPKGETPGSPGGGHIQRAGLGNDSDMSASGKEEDYTGSS